MATATLVSKLARLADAFISQKGGSWEHDDWEAFCAQAANAGVVINDDTRVALGNLLEALRYFHTETTAVAPAKKAVVRRTKKTS